MVGKLNFIYQSRPDITFAVNIVSRFCHNPQVPHLIAVKHLFRYIKGTMDFGLLYRRGEDIILLGFSDVD
jgi:hypothetical protein